ncbi:hypothetical protein BST81_04270 [Leptolyngbya sp. 'hensonii']|nr:hypothetical protein BST81_04270 [Leptolyngbya sp. 'hensonii']
MKANGSFCYCSSLTALGELQSRHQLRIVDLITPKFSALTPNPQPLPLSRWERGQGGEGNQEFIGVI